MNLCSNNYTESKQNIPVPDCLNQHEVTNLYRRMAQEQGIAASPEQQTNDEWLAEFDVAEVFS